MTSLIALDPIRFLDDGISCSLCPKGTVVLGGPSFAVRHRSLKTRARVLTHLTDAHREIASAMYPSWVEAHS